MVKKARKSTKRRTTRAAPVRTEKMEDMVTGTIGMASKAMIGVGVMSAIGGMFQPK